MSVNQCGMLCWGKYRCDASTCDNAETLRVDMFGKWIRGCLRQNGYDDSA